MVKKLIKGVKTKHNKFLDKKMKVQSKDRHQQLYTKLLKL